MPHLGTKWSVVKHPEPSECQRFSVVNTVLSATLNENVYNKSEKVSEILKLREKIISHIMLMEELREAIIVIIDHNFECNDVLMLVRMKVVMPPSLEIDISN